MQALSEQSAVGWVGRDRAMEKWEPRRNVGAAEQHEDEGEGQGEVSIQSFVLQSFTALAVESKRATIFFWSKK